MPFVFKLHDPPCDVAFLSIVDGEALYTADNARTRDVKEATIRQIGWHRVSLPQDWFLSARALETTAHVLEVMQCTVQYLKYRSKSEEKRNLKLSATLQRCEEERAAAFEELIELRETVALYKQKLRELSQGACRRAAAGEVVGHSTSSSLLTRAPAATPSDGLQCAFCENVYPSRHALESHFRKRHKRPPGYAAMAAASAAVGQQQQQKVQQQHVMTREELSQGGGSGLPFMGQTSSPRAPLTTAAGAAAESRGERNLRDELSELRLTVAKLLIQQAEFYKGVSPLCVAAVPMAAAGAASTTPTDTNAPAVTRASSPSAATAAAARTNAATAVSGPLPGLLSSTQGTDKDKDENVALRIPRELLRTSAELQLLQDALERGEGCGTEQKGEGKLLKPALPSSSPSPRDIAPAVQAHPTLDPRSFLRFSASDSVNDGAAAAGAEARHGSTVDSLVEVSPMSPSSPMAQHASLGRDDNSSKGRHRSRTAAGERAGGWGMLTHVTAADRHDSTGAPRASLETQSPGGNRGKQTDTSRHASAYALSAPSEYGSMGGQDDLTASSNGCLHPYPMHTPLTGSKKVARHSTDSTKLLALGPETDSPMVRLPSSVDAVTHASSKVQSPSANRYGPPPGSEEASQVTSNNEASGTLQEKQKALLHTQQIKSPPASASASASASHSTKAAPLATVVHDIPARSLLTRKDYGPVPSVPILRPSTSSSSSSSNSLLLAKTRESNTATHPSAAVKDTHATSHAVIQESAERAGATGGGGSSDGGAQYRGSPDPAFSRGGVRSPTQTPRRGSTPPTSRVAAAQVPALDLSTVSPHASADQPQRSASPFVGHAYNARHSGGAAADAVVQGSLQSSSGVLHASFTSATRVQMQKTIPVVRLVPAAPSDSAELTQKLYEDDNGEGGNETSALSFSNADPHSQPALPKSDVARTTKTQKQDRTAGEMAVLKVSDASYSIEAPPSEAPEAADDNDSDAMNAGVYDVFTANSSASLRQDIAVDQASSESSQYRPHGQRMNDDPVMEDVLTDDLVQAPLFRSSVLTCIAASQRSGKANAFSEDVSEAAAREADETEATTPADSSDEGSSARPHGAVEAAVTESDAAKKSSRDEVKEDAESVSGDYSYSYYSYSDDAWSDEGDVGSEPKAEKVMKGASGVANNEVESSRFSLGTPAVPPPIAVSQTTVHDGAGGGSSSFASPTADGNSRGEDDETADEEVRHTTTKEGKKVETKAKSAVTVISRDSASRSAGLPRVFNTEVSGSAEASAVPQTHNNSFHSNMSHTMKKAGGAFKSIFSKKKKS
jgi:hypothetical protein